MSNVKNDEIRQAVRQQYGQVATSESAGCGCGTTCCDASAPSGPQVVVEQPGFEVGKQVFQCDEGLQFRGGEPQAG